MKKNIIYIIGILLILSSNSYSNDIEHRVKMDYKASVGSIDPNGQTMYKWISL